MTLNPSPTLRSGAVLRVKGGSRLTPRQTVESAAEIARRAGEFTARLVAMAPELMPDIGPISAIITGIGLEPDRPQGRSAAHVTSGEISYAIGNGF